MYQFRLNGRPLSVTDLVAEYAEPSPDNNSTDAQNIGDLLPFAGGDASQPRIVWRERSQVPVKKKVFMSETGTYPQDITVNAENGFYVVQPHESVIFLSKTRSSGVPYFKNGKVLYAYCMCLM